jgi:hypothetical protein
MYIMSGDLLPIMRRIIFGADGVEIGLVDVYRTQTSIT